MEIWKDIPELGGKYQASNLGNIKSGDKMVRCHLNHKGYYIVNLYNGTYKKTRGVHRWIALTFIENPNNLAQVNHKDGDKLNNVVSNLEWITCSNNIYHAYANGLHNVDGSRNSQSKLTDKDVLEIRDIYKRNPKTRLKLLSERFGVTEQLISMIKLRRAWTHI